MVREKHKGIFLLSLATLGVVYGDIGTSPLYAVNQIFFGLGRAKLNVPDILGAISLVFWSITLLIACKYIIFVLRADNRGEGGVFALYGLIDKLRSKRKWLFITLLMVAAGLLFGDGIITPAISVISSVEGLGIATSAFTPFIVPITLGILLGLFSIQSKGTAKVGSLFAPVIIVWFITIAVSGLYWILKTPQILSAFNPYFGIAFLFTHSFLDILLTLGAVMLVITGGEALYADMGHFGAQPIRLSWFSVTYPALILNYLGQGAFLLGKNQVINGNVFFSMIPHVFLIPMVIIATCATIIASQALISGAFSLSKQAISLGLFPFLRVVHTHGAHQGQIYVPLINWLLFSGCALLVLIFQSSSHLASAYGLAVSGSELVTSLAMTQIALYYWKWKPVFAYGIFLAFALIDFTFLSSNSLKIVEGGYIPLGIGVGLLIFMKTWQWGRRMITRTYKQYPTIGLNQYIALKKEVKEIDTLNKTLIIMSPEPVTSPSDNLPMLAQLFLDKFHTFPRNMLFVTVEQTDDAYENAEERHKIINLYHDTQYGQIISVILCFGFMEEPDVEKALTELVNKNYLTISHNHNEWLIRIVQERMHARRFKNIFSKFRYELFKIISRSTESADLYFGLGKEKHLTAEIMPVVVE